MPDEEQKASRFRRVRDAGGSIRDALDTVSGRSIAEDMDEFSDAYADVLQGIHADVETLKRNVAAIPDTKDDEAHAELARLRVSLADTDRKLRLTMRIAVISTSVAIIAILIAILV